ncbi:MAG TPA: tetratricopeptide repeat protein [Gemmatimonadaceae bacterium]|jgi:predicted regulator of Ras-like GTPase activity (Roadblock/LC7/MglB family)|nr:tetratricopeptide repeat protein [Gemmatimonadaceae bacterium]
MSTSDEIRRWSDELACEPSSLVFLRLGEAMRQHGQLEIALKIALRGLERHAYNTDAHDLVARIAVDCGDYERASNEWQTVLALSPDHVGARRGLGYVSYLNGRLDDAEQHLAQVATLTGDGAAVTALRTVRRISGATTSPLDRDRVVAVVSAPVVEEDPQRLFADVLIDEGQTAVLLDGGGFVLGGLYIDPDGNDVSQEFGAHLSTISDEAHRAMRHLDIGAWRSMVFETHAAVVAMAPATGGSLLVVAASRATQLGRLRWLLERCVARAGQWLSRDARSPS